MKKLMQPESGSGRRLSIGQLRLPCDFTEVRIVERSTRATRSVQGKVIVDLDRGLVGLLVR